MVCCLTAPSHCLNQSRFKINEVSLHWIQGIVCLKFSIRIPKLCFKFLHLEITTTPFMGQWVKTPFAPHWDRSISFHLSNIQLKRIRSETEHNVPIVQQIASVTFLVNVSKSAGFQRRGEVSSIKRQFSASPYGAVLKLKKVVCQISLIAYGTKRTAGFFYNTVESNTTLQTTEQWRTWILISFR